MLKLSYLKRKQVKFLYEPVAVRCKVGVFLTDAANQRQAIEREFEKAKNIGTESKYFLGDVFFDCCERRLIRKRKIK